jgi:ribosome maturation factor RimP
LYRTVVIALVICIGILPANDLAALAADTPARPELVKRQLDQFGMGAKLKVQLADGKKLKGSVVSLGEESFELKTKPGDSVRQIAYNNVNAVKLAKLTYRAKGTPDAVETRRVVLGLGVGRHIQVKTTAGKECHGNIQAIGTDSFNMLPDRETAPVQVTFSEVVQLGPNLSTGAKIAIGVGIAVAVVVLVMVGVYVWGPSS